MLSGEKLALAAMKKEHKRLSKKSDDLESEVNEYLSIGTEMLAIHKEFAEIVKSGETGNLVIKKLGVLKKRSANTEKIQKKDFMKLSDRQFKASMDAMNLGSEISRLEFRAQIRNGD